MNRQNFDTESVGNYPLTIDRMAEAQSDWQVPMRILAAMLPEGNCILAGCENAGEAGWVRLMNEQGLPEVLEVAAGDSLSNYLQLEVPPAVTAENSDGETVVVRQERRARWVTVSEEQSPAANCVEYATLPRMRTRLTPQDDAGYTVCTGGLWWHTPANGTSLRVQRRGGKVRLWGSVKYGLLLAGMDRTIYTGDTNEIILERGAVRTTASTVPVLPEGYRPTGSIVVPVLYNGVANYAVIDSDGQLLVNVEPELGDTLEIDTWIDV